MEVASVASVLVAIIVAISLTYAFQLYIRHQRRAMVHRERLAAIEKGLELPPLEQEIQRGSWNVQRLLLMAGLIWFSLGVAAFPMLNEIAGHSFRMPWGYDNTGNPFFADILIPRGTQWIALAPIGIGLSHVVVFLVGKKTETRGSEHEK